jgi:hypothetical protein
MPRRLRTPKRLAIPDHIDTAVCIKAFRPTAISRMIELGDRVRLDDEIVRRNPSHFAVRLDELLESTGDAK